MSYPSALLRTLAATVAAGFLATLAVAQPAQPQPGGRRPAVVSPEVMSDGQVVFRVAAPVAQAVTLSAGDITVLFSGSGAGAIAGTNISTVLPAAPLPQAWPEFKKNDKGIWEATVGPLPPGAYRYVFIVDGVRTLDPVNTRSAESNTNMWSLFTVPGADMFDTTDVPHGAVARITYYSTVLKTFRRMHIYTPPGYEAGNQKYPVFYLLHGSGDTDDAWISVGRANFIFDNLIAAKKAKPMIVVMPAGHQPAGAAGRGGPAPDTAAAAPAVNPFANEFITDMLPYIEKHYRTINDRSHRAIAGLSMGGGQTLDIAFTHLSMFAQIGVFSSGASLGGGRRVAAPPVDAASGRGAVLTTAETAPAAATAGATTPGLAAWEKNHLADLDNAGLKKGTRLVWFSTGKDDRLITNSKSTVDLLKKHGFDPIFLESAGAHSWFNWRNYLIEFTPQLF